MSRLGVNLDHIATLRQARREGIPSPLDAMPILCETGVNQVTLHVREDRRHMNEEDLKAFIEDKRLPVNLEMAVTDEMLALALKYRPATCTLVPEKREEITTEGGLDLTHQTTKIREMVSKLKNAGIQVSLFIDPDAKQVTQAIQLETNAIEIHTGNYARSFNGPSFEAELERVKQAAILAAHGNLNVYAGHGLDVLNLAPLTQLPIIKEYNIGFSIIARSIYIGLKEAILEISRVLKN